MKVPADLPHEVIQCVGCTHIEVCVQVCVVQVHRYTTSLCNKAWCHVQATERASLVALHQQVTSAFAVLLMPHLSTEMSEPEFREHRLQTAGKLVNLDDAVAAGVNKTGLPCQRCRLMLDVHAWQVIITIVSFGPLVCVIQCKHAASCRHKTRLACLSTTAQTVARRA